MKVSYDNHTPPSAVERQMRPAPSARGRWCGLELVTSLGAFLVGLACQQTPSAPPPAGIEADASPLPFTIELRPVVAGLTQPLFVTHAGDGSGEIYILEKGGRIKLAENGVVRPQPFLDVSSKVRSTGSEQGLLGLAFHPKYKDNGYLYVNYTDRNGDTMIARYIASGDRGVADPTTAKTILAFDQPFANHNGGMLLFGPDGKLWIGTGDGGSGGDPRGNAQNRGHLLGKMLRIDVDGGDPYGIPPDNPFLRDPSARPEVWAIGLRNPWRYSFDRLTGDLYIGDVGQNAWEEIDFVPARSKGGLNFGWNIMEGAHCFPASRSTCDQSGLGLPIAEYPIYEEGCSVTGGYVYRGKAFPALAGAYLFTDYCSGTIWSLRRGADGLWQRTQMLPGPGGHAGFSSFGEDEAGELYVTALEKGTVYRLIAK